MEKSIRKGSLVIFHLYLDLYLGSKYDNAHGVLASLPKLSESTMAGIR